MVKEQPQTDQEENFVRPKLNSIVINQRPTISRLTVTQDKSIVRPKMNSIVIHKRSTIA